MKTILITGSSSGIGKSSTLKFLSENWNVIATMRNPADATFDKKHQLLVTKLDVTQENTIKEAIDLGIQKFGKIDAVLNNAGFGQIGPFEASSTQQIQKQFNTNVFGVMNVIKAILPHYKTNNQGIIANVTSIGGLMSLPYFSIYHATKFAIEGLTESLQYELEPFNIQVKLLEPGGVATNFAGRSLSTAEDKKSFVDYQNHFERFTGVLGKRRSSYSTPESIAQGIYEAITDNTGRLRYPLGEDAQELLALRATKKYPEEFFAEIKQMLSASSN